MGAQAKDHNGHEIAKQFFGYRALLKQDAVHENGDQAIIQKPSQQKGNGKEIAQIFFGKKSDGKEKN